MSWEDLKDHTDYEINTEYPYPIRNKVTPSRTSISHHLLTHSISGQELSIEYYQSVTKIIVQ